MNKLQKHNLESLLCDVERLHGPKAAKYYKMGREHGYEQGCDNTIKDTINKIDDFSIAYQNESEVLDFLCKFRDLFKK